MIILYFGDIFGNVGRKAVASALPDLISRYSPDFIIGNAENLAGGRGVNKKSLQEMFDMGFHALTSGNHIWDNKEIYPIFEQDVRLLRPANYPSSGSNLCPGKGAMSIHSGNKEIFLINLMGRVFMDQIECPFQTIDRILAERGPSVPIIVDMHAEASSEKTAMGWYCSGRVTAVVGTHTHVQTADERILPGGTAYISDIGLSGAFDSVIGMNKEAILKRFVTKRPTPFQLAEENPGICCVVIHIGPDRRATSIERIRQEVKIYAKLSLSET